MRYALEEEVVVVRLRGVVEECGVGRVALESLCYVNGPHGLDLGVISRDVVQLVDEEALVVCPGDVEAVGGEEAVRPRRGGGSDAGILEGIDVGEGRYFKEGSALTVLGVAADGGGEVVLECISRWC